MQTHTHTYISIHIHTHKHTGIRLYSIYSHGAPTLARSFDERVCAHARSSTLSLSAWSLITFLTRSARHTADDDHVHVMRKCTMPIGSRPTLTLTLTLTVLPRYFGTSLCLTHTRAVLLLLTFLVLFALTMQNDLQKFDFGMESNAFGMT